MQTGITPDQVVLFRSLASALCAGAVLAISDRSSFKLQKNELLPLSALGVVGVALMQWSYSNAVSLLPVGIALLIEYNAILIVPIASLVIFKTKVSARLWLGAVLVICGLLVVSNIWAGGLNPVGIAFAFGAAIFLSVYFILGERVQKSRSSMSLLFYSMLISSIFWMIASPWWRIDSNLLTQTIDLSGNLAGVALPAWQLMIWVGIAGSFAPMLLSFLALRHLSASTVGITSTAETLFAFAFAWLWLKEEISLLQTIGGALVLAGIIFAQTSRRHNWQQSN